MNTARTILALLALLTNPTPRLVSAQESPDVLTTAEHQCQNAFGEAQVDLSGGTAACLAECETSPGRRCNLSFPDAITGDCLSRVQAAAEARVLRQCAGTDCPECYAGGLNCPAYAEFNFSQEASFTAEAISALYCDDSSSPDGLTKAEQSCQRGLVRAGERFGETVQRCFANCAQAVQRGATSFSSCESASVDTPTLDPRTQHCIDRARARFLSSCEDHCTDPPDCFPFSCSVTTQLVESQAFAAQPTTYCQDIPPPVCGDGQITGNEVCDPTASPTGCAGGELCVGCFECLSIPVCGDGQITYPEECDPNATPTGCPEGETCANDCECVTECGNGVVDSGEVCDPAVPASCGPGTTCTQTCDACISTASATEDLTPCEPPVFDRWSFQVMAGQTVLVHADTVDAATAADLCFSGSCSDGQFFEGDDDVACSFPPPDFSCPEDTFTASSDSTCTVDVTTCSASCSDDSTARYRLDVTGSDLTLVLDDASTSAEGAFVRAPAHRAK